MGNVERQISPASVVREPLSISVSTAVDNYLESMDGHSIENLYDMVLSEIEMPMLECVMKYTGDNQSQAATMLGLNRGTLRKKLKKYGML